MPYFGINNETGELEEIPSYMISSWQPQTFKYKRDKEAFEGWIQSKPKRGSKQWQWDEWKNNKPEDRAIPQVTVDGDSGKELCPSVEELAEDVPEIRFYSDYGLLNHRLGILKGFKEAAYEGKVQARCGGLANTLRLRHREVVNLPGVDKPYGNLVRGVLIAPEGYVLCGSDLSALEDRVKHSLMIPHDYEYVEKMLADDYDPHLQTALSSGMITQKQFDDYKAGNKSEEVSKARKVGKCTNYASVYGAGAATIARTAGISLEEAEIAHKGYWDLNWSVQAIAAEQVVIETSRGERWLVNPFNGFCYSLRTDKDKFSTLIQGSGSYFFDMWLDGILESQKKVFGKMTCTFQMQDEWVICIKDRPKAKEWLQKVTKESLDSVNLKYKLRRELGFDIQFGESYKNIH
ncbi:MAG: putative DNA polymerase [Prokaryotic dsDNA virus sp.]|nr:MAG: putative DNA polymerase [Prokaryotic dsDNA virus sp.]|tara:strand:+ start:41451 stop:42665 length:1215 start_codon:yes stop_codon:yes gene_type:complete